MRVDQRVPPLCQEVKAPLADTGCKSGALELARRIEARWAKLGHKVECWVESEVRGKEGRQFIVRSDLVNGLPRRDLDDR